MARIEVNGLELDYELVGKEGDPAVAITPGGRFPRDYVGVPELAGELAKGGYRVLLWDRPNCGASEITFDGPSESAIQGQALAGIIRELKLGPTALCGGSAGSRVSLIAAAAAPEQISHLVLWWISGGPISLAQLAAYYCGDSATRAATGGMKAVADSPMWADQLARRPDGRDVILAQDPDDFIETMQRWAKAYAYSDSSPVPGIDEKGFKRLDMPALVYRSGKSDMSHTRRTSEWVAELLPNAEIVDPPWGDQEWNERSGAAQAGEPGRGHFENWPALAPEILEFLGR